MNSIIDINNLFYYITEYVNKQKKYIMSQNWKSLIFSTAFLTIAAFSAQAMEDENEISRIKAFCEQKQLPEDFADEIYAENKGKAFKLNKYGVRNIDFYAAYLFYRDTREVGCLEFLDDLLTTTPQEKRVELFSDLNSCTANFGDDPSLAEFYIGRYAQFIGPYSGEKDSKVVIVGKLMKSEELTEEYMKPKFFKLYKDARQPGARPYMELEKMMYTQILQEKAIMDLTKKLFALPYIPIEM